MKIFLKLLSTVFIPVLTSGILIWLCHALLGDKVGEMISNVVVFFTTALVVMLYLKVSLELVEIY